jgi:hypothetical protein
MDKNHLQVLKNLRKNIFSVLEAYLFTRKSYFRRKIHQIYSQDAEIFDIFEIFKLV